MAASNYRMPRRVQIAGLLTGLAGGLVLALGLLSQHDSGRVAQALAGAGWHAVARSGTEQNPVGLDSEWAAYSDRSTCADWAGGDGLSAVRLSSSQVAWFFSDTYLGPAGQAAGFSLSSGLVHNSVVVQTRSGHGTRFVTLTGGGTCATTGSRAARPAAVVGTPQAPGKRSDRYWGEDGIEAGGTVVKFYNRYLPGNAPYTATGTVIAAFSLSQLSAAGRDGAPGEVARPRLFPLPSYTPAGDRSPVVWGAALARTGSSIYVYGTRTPDTAVPDRELYLARVPASRLTRFAAWQFYAGAGRWVGSQQDARPLQAAGSDLSVSSGFSVVRAGQRYWLIQADPLAGSQDIDAFPAAAPWGPFDRAAGVVLYRDAGIGANAAHDYRIMYEARVIPALSTSRELVIGYNVNSLAITTGCLPMSWFTDTVTQPRFITVPLAMLGGDRPGDAAGGGAADYPRVVSSDPAQWFDEWDYPDGCPPVPGVTDVQARPRAGAVELSWPSAGLGVGYRVYVLPPGAASYLLKTIVGSDDVTLAGLPAGRYLARVVPVNLRHQAGPAGLVAFTVPDRPG